MSAVEWERAFAAVVDGMDCLALRSAARLALRQRLVFGFGREAPAYVLETARAFGGVARSLKEVGLTSHYQAAEKVSNLLAYLGSLGGIHVQTCL